MTLAGVPAMWNGIVDVRDVADAHIATAFSSTASGRYIISGGSLSLMEMGKILRKNFGNFYPFPRNQLPKIAFKAFGPAFGFSRAFVDKNMGYPIFFNANKSRKELGMNYRDIEVSLVEHFQQMIDDGLVKKFIFLK